MEATAPAESRRRGRAAAAPTRRRARLAPSGGPGPRLATALLVGLIALAGALLVPTASLAAPGGPASSSATAPSTQTGRIVPTVPPVGLPDTPDDYAISARRALRIADRDPTLRAEKLRRGRLTATVDAEPVRRWEVGYYDGSEKVVLVVVDAVNGDVVESWTGIQVTWPMARGREGQFGHLLNAPFVWIPLAAIFFLGLLEWRRPLRIVHLDLLVLLSFGISEAFFNAAEIGVSVPLYYPPILYLLARMAWIGFGGARGQGLRPSIPTRALIVLCVGLAIFRIGLNVLDSGVIDVGYAGVIGADRIVDAEPIYGEGAFPGNNPTGDTYGPANYFAYVPFEQLLPWSGAWDDLPAAHAAAIFFDLFCVAGLLLLGRRLRRVGSGTRLGLVLAFAWLAYPYTDYVLQSNSNDSLLAALLIWSLVLFAQPLGRGALLGVAAMTKFAPLVLAPLFLAGHRGLLWARPRRLALRPILLYGGAFSAAIVLFAAHPAIDPGLAAFYDRTIGSQAARQSPFSIWGQADLEWLHTLVKVAAVAIALAAALVPKRRSFTQIAALGAAVMIAVELTAAHWFYLYIVWFLPMLLVAIATGAGDDDRPPKPGLEDGGRSEHRPAAGIGPDPPELPARIAV